MAERAASNALATAFADADAPTARADAASKNPAYGAAAADMAAAAAPCHAWPVSPEVTDVNDCAAVPNSSANPSQAAAACSIGADPAPVNMRSELISGGKTKKFIS
ncbi:hypothetical protein NIIDMKKI_56430 [Mycobacterium kansasii]|uniref:Uncharacterized protein n=1 Tax=Mycobacterium kansasii TaxID=1768 RepID=A0A653F1H0_MYCKA|nr:hypothetical protein NIIDMKKI_56430 [Mycobacterium kansasii]VTP02856.1 hypothetical protein BIN_B_03650 [Mycobacterium kansasii]